VDRQIQGFKELIVWQKAYRFTLNSYRASEAFLRSGISASCRNYGVLLIAGIRAANSDKWDKGGT